MTEGKHTGFQSPKVTSLTFWLQCKPSSDRAACNKRPDTHYSWIPQDTSRDVVQCFLQVNKTLVDCLGKVHHPRSVLYPPSGWKEEITGRKLTMLPSNPKFDQHADYQSPGIDLPRKAKECYPPDTGTHPQPRNTPRASRTFRLSRQISWDPVIYRSLPSYPCCASSCVRRIWKILKVLLQSLNYMCSWADSSAHLPSPPRTQNKWAQN